MEKKRESCKRIEISIPMEKNRDSHFSKNRAALEGWWKN